MDAPAGFPFVRFSLGLVSALWIIHAAANHHAYVPGPVVEEI